MTKSSLSNVFRGPTRTSPDSFWHRYSSKPLCFRTWNGNVGMNVRGFALCFQAISVQIKLRDHLKRLWKRLRCLKRCSKWDLLWYEAKKPAKRRCHGQLRCWGQSSGGIRHPSQSHHYVALIRPQLCERVLYGLEEDRKLVPTLFSHSEAVYD